MNKIIIFPTDTVYGIGTGIENLAGINKIYEIKGRDFTKPMAVLCASLEQVSNYVILNKEALALAKAFWPGALTLVLKTTDSYFKQSREKTLGIRIPNHAKALELLKLYGPMKTTSVNQSNEKPLNDYLLIKQNYENLVDEIYPNNEPIAKVSSTVINLTEKLFVIREGSITINQIEETLKSL